MHEKTLKLCELAELEKKAEATARGITSLKTKIKKDLEYAKITSPVIKLHVERVCIADRKRDLEYLQNEHKKMQQKISSLKKQLEQT